jgi:tetratricopeptide (TPR) repeat protein
LALVLGACATFPTQSLQDVAGKHQEEAARLEQAGRLGEALERWKVVLTIDPGHAEARRKKAELEAKARARAIEHVAAGRKQLERRDKQGAQREFVAALRLDPSNREAVALLHKSEEELGEKTAFARPMRQTVATTARGRGGTAPAKAPPEEEAEEEESGEEISFAEAVEIFRKGDYLNAIDAFTRVLAHQPGMREALEYQKLAYYNQGVAYLEKHNYADALRMFDQLRRLQPDFKRVAHYSQTAREKLADEHHLAGIRHFREQRLKEAIEEWDQALALNPKLESAKKNREQARRLLRSLEERQ